MASARPYAPVIIWFLVLVLTIVNPVSSFSARQTATSAAVPNLNLRQYFQDEFAPASEVLSPHRIVEMLPKKGSSSAIARTGKSTNAAPLRQEMFSSPLISVLYERVLPPLWAAGLRIGGPDEEYQNAVSYLVQQNDDREPGIALDLSCGTGFVGIRMAKSGYFRHVFALDYSEQMLSEAVATIKREQSRDASMTLPLSLIRGDAGRLPFKDGVFDAVHWGAAMHCVPDAEQAMSEVYRVLKPGGRVYATTFLRPFPDLVFRFFDLNELINIAKGAGFGETNNDEGELEVQTLRRLYGVIRATKGNKRTVGNGDILS